MPKKTAKTAPNPTARYAGKDNNGRSKTYYLRHIAAMSAADLSRETEQKIWLSTYAINNPRSDFHWHVDACWDEWQRRNPDGYNKAYKAVERQIG